MHDRGMKKWTQMMLPEHRALLKELDRKKSYAPRPDLDQQELEEMMRCAQEAYATGNPVMISYWTTGHVENITGTIQKFDQQRGQFRLDDGAWYKWKSVVSLALT
ncbi:YolD-like family protein [Salisediminibacterium beveridgei]|uniref:YolD-like protein n=1 Tax=Salisediminibacterium beveridgei TaxID=632773 RepID=A0A1D7QV93_9BACI|nr:YolD-like family protein [Salisediminibacterium beveridgei]AOM82930.1 hypothetical protein BBEV_1569 [Salisediminibacterium beveridgei]